MRRVLALVLATVTLGAGITGCREDDAWPPERGAPSLRPAFGARVTDGQLLIWTGSRCDGVTKVNLEFTPSLERLVLAPPPGQTATVEHLVVGGPSPGLHATQALPVDFDWHGAESMRFWIIGHPGGPGSSADLAEVTNGSAEHDDDTYWFQDVGWLNPAQVAEKDGKTFLTTCAEEPAQ